MKVRSTGIFEQDSDWIRIANPNQRENPDQLSRANPDQLSVAKGDPDCKSESAGHFDGNKRCRLVRGFRRYRAPNFSEISNVLPSL